MNKDLISRQDAIKEVSKYVHGVDMIIGNGALSMAGCIDIAEEILEGLPSMEPEHKWIPCSERLPEEDHWLGGSGKQFSDNVLISILNNEDEDEWVYISHTIDGEWALELPRYCKILAWMPLSKPYKGGEM